MMPKKLNLCLVMILGTSAYATGFIGPPMAEIEAKHWDLALEYASSSEDLDTLSLSGTQATTLNETGDPCSFSINFKNYKMTQYAGIASYGLNDDWQVSLKLGMANVKASADSTKNGQEPLNFGSNFTYGLGTKFNYYKIEDTVWGISAQLNMVSGKCKRQESGTNGNGYDYTESISYDIDLYDLILAIGPTLDTGGIRTYGGLYYHSISGTYTEKRYNVDTSPFWTQTNVKGDMKVSSSVGAFLGAQLLFVGNTNIKAEVSVSPDSVGFVVGGGYTF